MDAVQTLLQTMSVRDLTMEAVAKQAGVGKPTLYKWWSSKAALVLTFFNERLALAVPERDEESFEDQIRYRVQRLIVEFQGQLGRITAELIAEGQSDPAVLKEFYDRHFAVRRAQIVASIERAKARRELRPDTKAEILVDEIFGPIHYRLILRMRPFDEAWGEQLVNQVLLGLRATSVD